MLPPAPPALKPAVEIINWFLSAGTIATMPRWMRRLSGFDQPCIVDIGVRPVLTLSFGIINRIPRLKLAVAGLIAPSMVPVAAPYILGVAPRSTEVLTPAEARRRYATPNRRTRISNCGPSNTIACSAKVNHPATKD
ncbi:MAG TPA: hypothetical protein VKG83_11845 [Mycobacterium sp.]|nr:hypothetical protein [Mycobacterium sp.]